MAKKVDKFYSTLYFLAPALVLFLAPWFIASGPSPAHLNSPQGAELIFQRKQITWVDSVFQTLTTREKIGQLFSIRVHSNWRTSQLLEVEKLIQQYHVGGLTFFQGGPYRQTRLSNRYQQLSRIPLLIALDAEWGLGMRLDSTISFPHQMTLGAIQDDSLIYEMGREVGRQCRRIGTHINFAPVVDVNINPNNPVIGDRSFGENKDNVARKGTAYMLGMQKEGLIANAKHFPGHGDTDQDSHYTLPIIRHSKSRLENIELYPFRKLIEKGLMSTMVAHLQIPSLDSTPGRPTTLSPKVVSQLLRNDMGFEGLIVTDALDMKGAVKNATPGEVAVLSFLAGNDVLLIPNNVPLAYNSIQRALQIGRISMEALDQRVKRILKAKYFAQLHTYQDLPLSGLAQDIHGVEAKILLEKLYASAQTLVRNNQDLIPFKRLDTLKIASLAIGGNKANTFQRYLGKYTEVTSFQTPKTTNAFQYQLLSRKLAQYNTVIISLHDMRKRAREGFGISPQTRQFIKNLQAQAQVVLTVFGSPYSLSYFQDTSNLLCAYEDTEESQKVAPQVLFGALPILGKLPVSAGPFKEGTGIRRPALGRLSYSYPEAVGMRSDTLRKLDSLINRYIRRRAMPGCQVLIARKGSIVWSKNYGYQTYNKIISVHDNTLYDIASITKVAASVPVIASLYEKGVLKLDDPALTYLPSLQASPKKSIRVRELLTHQAGLTPYIPYWEKTLNPQGGLSSLYYRQQYSLAFPHPVAGGIYASKNMEETLWNWTLASQTGQRDPRTRYFPYKYSDLSFYFLKRIADSLLQQPWETFLNQDFYKPLGMNYTGYRPLDRFPMNQIVPTERDQLFRRQLIQGTVHDQGAAMLGGIAGHAGLFSNAQDLAKYFQLYLQEGLYGGQRYLEAKTIEEFTRTQYPNNKNRRGLGWDKPEEGKEYSYLPNLSSPQSFGHSGFTGCVVWIDPQEELILIFLSNRIHPSVDNRLLIKDHVRRKALNYAFRAITMPQ